MRRVLLLLGAAVMALCCGCNDEWLDLNSLTNQQEIKLDTPVVNTVTNLSGLDFSAAESEEDLIDESDFSRTISIVFSDNGGATVSGDKKGIVTVSGNQVVADNSEVGDKVIYKLSGSTTNGFFKIYSSKKMAIVLDGVSITNPNGAAINNQSKKRTFVVVNGTNTLADGPSYTATPEDEDEKAAFFSEGQLIFSGTGTLNVTAKGKAGITSDDYVRVVASPTITVSSSGGHGVRGKDMIVISDGTLDVSTSATGKKAFSSDSLVFINGGRTTLRVSASAGVVDGEVTGTAGIKADKVFAIKNGVLDITNSGQGGKGINCDGPGYFLGGEVRVTTTGANYGSSGSNRPGPNGNHTSTTEDNSSSAKGIKCDGNLFLAGTDITVQCASHEGIESKGLLEITGGHIYSYSSDDAINAAGNLTIAGGYVCAISTYNDGIDANGNCYLQGGVVYAVGAGTPEVAVDANTEGGFRLYFSSGTLVAIGGLEGGASLAQACYSASWTKSSWYALYDGEKPVLAFKTPTSGGNGIVVSTAGTPSLKSGISTSGGTEIFDSMARLDATVSGGTAVSLSAYTSGSGMGFPGGPGGRPW